MHAALDGLDVGREVDAAELGEGDDGVALVLASLGAPIPDEVFGSGSNEDVAGERRDGVVSAGRASLGGGVVGCCEEVYVDFFGEDVSEMSRCMCWYSTSYSCYVLRVADKKL